MINDFSHTANSRKFLGDFLSLPHGVHPTANRHNTLLNGKFYLILDNRELIFQDFSQDEAKVGVRNSLMRGQYFNLIDNSQNALLPGSQCFGFQLFTVKTHNTV